MDALGQKLTDQATGCFDHFAPELQVCHPRGHGSRRVFLAHGRGQSKGVALDRFLIAQAARQEKDLDRLAGSRG
jgi:hypothetical protein